MLNGLIQSSGHTTFKQRIFDVDAKTLIQRQRRWNDIVSTLYAYCESFLIEKIYVSSSSVREYPPHLHIFTWPCHWNVCE